VARGNPPYRVGWDPEWLSEPMDVRLTWPTWEYEKKMDAVRDAHEAAKHAYVPVVVYDRKLNIVASFAPKGTHSKPPINNELIERLRKEMLDETR